MKHVLRLFFLVAIVAAGVAAEDAKALVKWNFVDANCVTCNDTSRTFSAFASDEGAAGAVTATGWANTGGTSNTLLEQGQVPEFGSSGIGVINNDAGDAGNTETTGSGEHSVDNIGRFDLVLFEFDDSVSVSEIGIGWFSGDADVSLLAWTGAGTPNLDNVVYSADAEGLTGDRAWQLIGNYDVDTTDPDPDQGNGDLDFVQAVDTDVSSNYWLVGAFNPVFDGPLSEGNESDMDSAPYYADKVKILSLAGTIDSPSDSPAGVPEPASLLLLVGSLVPLAYRRRRKAPTASS